MTQLPRTLITALTCTLALILLILPTIAVAADTGVPQRSDIDDSYKWKVNDMFADDAAWEESYVHLDTRYAVFEQYRGRLGESPQVLLECLSQRDRIELIADNLYIYAYLKLDEDNRVSLYQEMGGRISQLWSRVSQAMSYIEPELLELGADRIESYLAEEPELGIYAHYLKDLQRQKEHILSDKEEALLALAGPATSAAGRIFGMINDADIKYGSILDANGEEYALTKQRYYKILESTDRDMRRRANRKYTETYTSYENTLAATLTGSVKSGDFYSQARAAAQVDCDPQADHGP